MKLRFTSFALALIAPSCVAPPSQILSTQQRSDEAANEFLAVRYDASRHSFSLRDPQGRAVIAEASSTEPPGLGRWQPRISDFLTHSGKGWE